MGWFRRNRNRDEEDRPRANPAAQRARLNEIYSRRPDVAAIAHALWAERQHNHFSESIAHLYRGGQR